MANHSWFAFDSSNYTSHITHHKCHTSHIIRHASQDAVDIFLGWLYDPTTPTTTQTHIHKSFRAFESLLWRHATHTIGLITNFIADLEKVTTGAVYIPTVASILRCFAAVMSAIRSPVLRSGTAPWAHTYHTKTLAVLAKVPCNGVDARLWTQPANAVMLVFVELVQIDTTTAVTVAAEHFVRQCSSGVVGDIEAALDALGQVWSSHSFDMLLMFDHSSCNWCRLAVLNHYFRCWMCCCPHSPTHPPASHHSHRIHRRVLFATRKTSFGCCLPRSVCCWCRRRSNECSQLLDSLHIISSQATRRCASSRFPSQA